MCFYWENDLQCLMLYDIHQSIETYVVFNGYLLNMYGAMKVTYHIEKYISTPLAKFLGFLFLSKKVYITHNNFNS